MENLRKPRNIKYFGIVIALSLVLIFTVEANANKWFSEVVEHVATQYAYGDTCVHVENVKTYFFGVLVSEELRFTPFQCSRPTPS